MSRSKRFRTQLRNIRDTGYIGTFRYPKEVTKGQFQIRQRKLSWMLYPTWWWGPFVRNAHNPGSWSARVGPLLLIWTRISK